MSADGRGLPIIAVLVLLNGLLVGWNVADLQAGIRLAKQRAIADANLERSESKWVGCLKHQVVTIGDKVYPCPAYESRLTVRDLEGLL